MPYDHVRTTPASWLRSPVVLAAVVTLVNAAKPAVVDDTAYLLFARQIAAHPFDPYGFDLFWYREPEPAMGILAPPVLLYWLAAGVRLFGEHLVLLKLWLFPFPLVLAYATRFLLARFARGLEGRLLPAIVLGPGILPFLNVMLDVPALALQVASVALFVRATIGRTSVPLVLAAGVCAGLAAQTKYSTLHLPAVLVLYGLIHRRLPAAIVVVAVGIAGFVTWEWFLVTRYGTSHFLHHLRDTTAVGQGTDSPTVWQRVEAVWTEKAALIAPLHCHLGVTAWWVGPLGLSAFGVGRTVIRWAFGIPLSLLAVLCFAPGEWAALAPGPYPTADRLTLNEVLFTHLGGLALGSGLLAGVGLLVRFRRTKPRPGASPAALFIVGWLVLELAAYFVLTPFPAGRRVLGVSFALALVFGYVWSRRRRLPGRAGGIQWVPAAAVISGFVLAGIDTLDAYPEKVMAGRVAVLAGDRGWSGTGWYVGHWGFQYHCDRVGMKPLHPGRSVLRPGDWLVLPSPPDGNWFYRPYDGKVRFNWDATAVVPELEFVWADPVSAQTIPNLYGGGVPVLSRKYPRLRVVVYRVVKPWRPTAAPPA